MTTYNSKRSQTSDSAAALRQLESLMTRYAALVWKTAAAYLRDPEDIKECVNDTFLEYYLHQDRYDPEKGSLAAFLSAIARKRAISAYRKTLSASRIYESNIDGDQNAMETLADPEAMPERIEERLDLENAMASLAPEDFDIIRMKYYDGMSIREIAEAMNLPYETVKKRHQRSLSRLRLILMLITVLALAALLSACAYMLLRHFGIVPGYGANADVDMPFYVLEEEVYAECDQYSIEIRKVLLTGGNKLKMVALLRRTAGHASEDIFNWSHYLLAGIDLRNAETGEMIPCDQCGTESARGMPDSEAEALMQIEWHLMEDAPVTDLILDFHDFSVNVRLTAAEETPLENYGYDMGDLGGIMADAYLKENHLMVDFYLLNDDVFQFSSLTFRDITITVEAEDGTLLTGSFCEEGTFVEKPIETWDFGPAEPGTYTIFITNAVLWTQLPESFRIPLPADGEEAFWEEVYSIPGGSLTLDGWAYRRPNPRVPEIPQEERAFHRYLRLAVTTDREDMKLIYFFPDIGWTSNSNEFEHPVSAVGNITDAGEEETDQASFWGLELKWEEGVKPEELCLTGGRMSDVHYIWEHSFTITVTVEE